MLGPVPVDCLCEALGLLTRRLGKVLARRLVNDPSAGVDDHAPGAPIHAILHNSFQIPALRANTRDKQRQVRSQIAHDTQLLRIGGPDDQRAVAQRIPLFSHVARHALVERHGFLLHLLKQLFHVHVRALARIEIIGHQVLDFSGAFVAGATQDDAPLLRHPQERFNRLAPQVWMLSDSIGLHTELHEKRVHVRIIGRTDVSALGIQDDRNLRRGLADEVNGHLQGGDAKRTPTLVESNVGLVGERGLVSLIDDLHVEQLDCMSRNHKLHHPLIDICEARVFLKRSACFLLNALGDPLNARVKPNADEQILGPTALELFNEGTR